MNDITALMQRLVLAAAKGCCQTLLPDDCRALVEALEKAQNTAAQQGNIACALFDEVTAQRQRIAELESHTVTVKLPELPVLGSDAEWYQGYAAGTSSMRKDCATALRAAGINVEAE